MPTHARRSSLPPRLPGLRRRPRRRGRPRARRPASASSCRSPCTSAGSPRRSKSPRRIRDVFCSVGTHPHYAHTELDIPVEEIVRLAAHPKIVAIGEAGLDYFYDNSPREAQTQGFRNHIAAAQETRAAARHPCARCRRRHRRHPGGGDGEEGRSRRCCTASRAGASWRGARSTSGSTSRSRAS